MKSDSKVSTARPMNHGIQVKKLSMIESELSDDCRPSDNTKRKLRYGRSSTRIKSNNRVPEYLLSSDDQSSSYGDDYSSSDDTPTKRNPEWTTRVSAGTLSPKLARLCHYTNSQISLQS